MTYKEDFFNFLKSNNNYLILNKDNLPSELIVRVPCNSKLDILYGRNIYSGELFDMDKKLENYGVYDKENDKIYAPSYNLRYNILKVNYDDENYIGKETLYQKISKEVNEKIQTIIDDNRTSIFNIDKIEVEPVRDDQVLNEFMDGKTSETLEDSYIKFHTNYDKDILNYLTNKNEFIENTSNEFISKNIETILNGLARTREAKKTLDMINNNKDHPYHKMREIVKSVKNNNCKTVNMTIFKDGKEQTFKYDASVIFPKDYLYTWNILKVAEREKFYENFGRNADIYFSDISKITYGKNTLYEDTKIKEKNLEKEFALA